MNSQKEIKKYKRIKKYKLGALAVLCNYRCSCRRIGLGAFEDHGSRDESYLGMDSGTFCISILYNSGLCDRCISYRCLPEDVRRLSGRNGNCYGKSENREAL